MSDEFDPSRTKVVRKAPGPLGLHDVALLGTHQLGDAAPGTTGLQDQFGGSRRQDRQSRLRVIGSLLGKREQSMAEISRRLLPYDGSPQGRESLRRDQRALWFGHRVLFERLVGQIEEYLLEAHDPGDRVSTAQLCQALSLGYKWRWESRYEQMTRYRARQSVAQWAEHACREARDDHIAARTAESVKRALVTAAEAQLAYRPVRGRHSEAVELIIEQLAGEVAGGEDARRATRSAEGSWVDRTVDPPGLRAWVGVFTENLREYLAASGIGGPQTAAATVEEEPPAPLPPASRTKTWVEFQVVWAFSGEPVPSVRLRVTTPDGNEAYHTTGGNGLVRIDPVDPGTCDLTCDLDGPRRETTLNFVRMGEVAGAGGGAEVGAEPEARSGLQVIAEIESHKVKMGETIESLAIDADMTWQELSIFNWGTAVPNEINKHLVADVGCTKLCLDGVNYMFDDSDNPGIMYIPRKWEETGLATAKRHVIQVGTDNRFILRLENEWDLRIPEAAYEVEWADGSKESGKLDRNGAAVFFDPPKGPVAVTYTDHDDIAAKSAAAIARKAFDDRDVSMILWTLKHSPEQMARIVEAYEEYFNDYSGKGFVEDVYEEVTDPDALALVETMMALAELPTRNRVEVVTESEA